MFGKRKTVPMKKYDPEIQKPILRCSICNGEQVAGFKNLKTGEFEEIMFIRNPEELESFKREYGIEEITKEY